MEKRKKTILKSLTGTMAGSIALDIGTCIVLIKKMEKDGYVPKINDGNSLNIMQTILSTGEYLIESLKFLPVANLTYSVILFGIVTNERLYEMLKDTLIEKGTFVSKESEIQNVKNYIKIKSSEKDNRPLIDELLSLYNVNSFAELKEKVESENRMSIDEIYKYYNAKTPSELQKKSEEEKNRMSIDEILNEYNVKNINELTLKMVK